MPSGKKIDDGFPTKLSFAVTPNIGLWAKQVTPPGWEGGGPNDTTTMENTRLRTRAPKKLLTMSDATLTCAYDPAAYNDMLTMAQVNQLVTTHFADGSTLAWYGWIDSFKPNEVKEGEQPTAQVMVCPSNQNADGVETNPVYTPPPS